MSESINETVVGVIGIGKMGNPIARHLKKAAKQVLVYDVNEAALKEMESYGIRPVSSLAELAENCNIVFILVGFDHEAKEVCAGDGGLFKGLRAGSTIVISSTVSPSTMALLAEMAPKDIEIVDAPLCRGEVPAETGKLLALVGSSDRNYEKVLPLLKTFCSDIEHLGPLGAGQVGKAVNNFLLWSCISANFEALSLGENYGLDVKKLRSALLKSSGDNWALQTWDQPRNMPWAEKDMMIVLEMADFKGLPMPMAGFIKENIKLVKREKGLLPLLPKS